MILSMRFLLAKKRIVQYLLQETVEAQQQQVTLLMTWLKVQELIIETVFEPAVSMILQPC